MAAAGRAARCFDIPKMTRTKTIQQSESTETLKPKTDDERDGDTMSQFPMIGRIIEEELRAQERSVSWFGRQLNCDRRNIYDIFRRHNIDTLLLMRISRILGVDFFKIYSESYKTFKDRRPRV